MQERNARIGSNSILALCCVSTNIDAKTTQQNTLFSIVLWTGLKFLAGDTLGRSSLVADGSNTHRIAAATCYLRCRLHRENERSGVSNLCASSRYLCEKIMRLREPFHPGMILFWKVISRIVDKGMPHVSPRIQSLTLMENTIQKSSKLEKPNYFQLSYFSWHGSYAFVY